MVKGLGTIDISIKFLDNKLDIKIIGCRNLKDADFIGKSDPYVKLFVLPGKHTNLKTKTVSNNLNPVFNSTFSFTLTRESAMNKTAVFQVFDEDPGKDGKLGEARIALREVPMESGVENKYSMDLVQFTDSPPRVITTQVRPPIVTPSPRPDYIPPVITPSRPDYSISSASTEQIRIYNSKLEEIIRKNKMFMNIDDDLVISLIVEQLAGTVEESNIKDEIEVYFNQYEHDIEELAKLKAENEVLEQEVELLLQRDRIIDGRLKYVIGEEKEWQHKIRIEEQRYNDMSAKHANIHDNYDYLLRQKLDEIEREIMEMRDNSYTWHFTTIWNLVQDWKMEIYNKAIQVRVDSFTEREIDIPTIVWGATHSWIEGVKWHIGNSSIGLNPFLGIIENLNIGNYDTCEEEERNLQQAHRNLLDLEKQLCSIRQERVDVKFQRDMARFNFLAELRAKEEALAFLKQEFSRILARAMDSHGYIDRREISRYHGNIDRELTYVTGQANRWQSRNNTSVVGITLEPQLDHNDKVINWKIIEQRETDHEVLPPLGHI